MTKMVNKMTTDLDLSVFHDGYKERIVVEEKRPKKPVAKNMMESGPMLSYLPI